MTNKTTQTNIPKSWIHVSVADIAEVQTGPFGSQLHESDYVKDGTPIITVENLRDGFVKITTGTPTVKKADVERLKKYTLKEGDVVFSRVGSVDRSSYVTKEQEGWMFSGRILRVRAKNGTNSKFLNHYFAKESTKNIIRNLAVGGTMPSLNTAIFNYVPAYSIPEREQNRIVAVLETWDQAIEKLKRKIEVKKEIKKGLMQKLLTGEIRLAGFTGNWSIHNLGELGKIISGGTPETSDPSYWGDGYIWVTPTEITKLKSRYISDSDKGISNLGLKNSSATLVPPQSLILCSRATIAECAINTVEVTTNQGFKNFVPKKIDIYFLYYWVKLNKKAFLRISAGSTFLEFGKGDMEKLRITIPDMKEQQEISEILTKADDEIERLQQKLTIIKDQKKYLLNNLITGTIRTPESLFIPN